MAYLLDTNAVIAVLREVETPIGRRVRQCRPDEVFVSAIVLHELFYGAFKSARVVRNVALVDGLRFGALEFSREDAREAGEIRAMLAAEGRPIGPYDVLIAGQARARGLVLVTRNLGELARVARLVVENWETGRRA